MAENVLVVHGGGPTAVINSSLYGVLEEAKESGRIGKVYGAIGGSEGILKERLLDLMQFPEDVYKRQEFFFGPAEPERRYINLEVNPKGTIVMGFGSGKVGRVRLEEKYKPYLGLSTEIREAEGLWLARYLISFKLLSEVFGGPPEETRFRKFYANFYKCGEMTEFPHYGMWSKVDSPAPDFHRPEFFGELSLVE